MAAIRYVVVVHGIGEQRQNETVISVVSRCAEARRNLKKRESYDVLTLGMACSQTGKAGAGATAPWLELRGIPQEAHPPAGSAAWQELEAPFLGEQSRRGDNLRFVDLHWADLLQADIKDVGQSPEVWSDGLLGRLKRKNAQIDGEGSAPLRGWFRKLKPAPDPRRVPSWAIEILRILKETVTLLRRFTAWRAQTLDETVFTKFLGDVQLYGEYAYCRGQAVRRFHDMMARIEQRHEREEDAQEERARQEQRAFKRREARYTIVAHSLGSIMSLDALLYAHAKPAVLLGTTPDDAPGLPFPGHLLREENALGSESCEAESQIFRERKDHLLRLIADHGEQSPELRKAWEAMKGEEMFRFLDTSWLERVDTFVTLGSPIDKFLVLWWLNYKHLLTPERWMDPSFHAYRRGRKIRFFNYADEQDPVGHHLDIAATAPAVQEVFAIEEDKVFNRCAVPGVAHTSYWKDLPLFKRIVHLAIDGGSVNDGKAPVQWFDARTYQKGLTYAYYVIPYAVLALHFFALSWAVYSQSWHGRTVASVLFLSTFLLGRRLIDLSLWWRQVLNAKQCDEDLGSSERKRAGARFRWRLGFLCCLYLGLAGIFFSISYASLPVPRLSYIGLISGLSLFAWWLLFLDHQSAWKSKGGLDDSATPVMDLNQGTFPLQLAALCLLGGALGGGFLLASVLPPLSDLPGLVASGIKMLPSPESLVRRITERAGDIASILTYLFSLAAIVFSYTWLRFHHIRWLVRGNPYKPDFAAYARDTGPTVASSGPLSAPPGIPVTTPLTRGVTEV